MTETPKFKKLREAMEDIFGTHAAPVIEVKVFETNAPERGADEEGAYFAHEFFITVKLDSRSLARRSRAEAKGNA